MYNLEEFKKLVAEGKINDKWYFYKRTEEQKQFQAEEIPQLVNYFKEQFNVILYPIYGTLLGIIRENDFILHDNDVDLAYLSLQSDKEKVHQEYKLICDTLKRDNLLARIMRIGQIHCFGESKRFKYDIWTSFLLDDKYFLFPIIDKGIDKSLILPFKSKNFRKTTLFIPNQTEKLLDYIYNDWKTPISDNWRKHNNKKIL